jgi:hypothetical protein
MAINLKVPRGKSFEMLTIFNVYAPSTHGNAVEVVKGFCTALEEKMTRTPEANIPIVGGDINA